MDDYEEGLQGQDFQERNPEVETLNLKRQVESGASWFFWIAGLSLVNSVLYLGNIEWGFFFGLGITKFIDVIALEVGDNADPTTRIIAFALDVVVASVFALFGFLSKKGRRWAFITGMILYILDAMLVLVVKDFFGLAFHAFALYCIFNGFKASTALKAKTEDSSMVPGTSLQPMAVSLDAKIHQDKPQKEAVWPVVITIISLIYAIFFALANIRTLSSPWKLAICLSLFGGVLGIAFKKKFGVLLLLAGSSFIILRMAYGIITTIITADEPFPVPAIIAIVVVTFVFCGWPAFLIIWFLRRPIRTLVKDKWT